MSEKLFQEIKWIWDNSFGNIDPLVDYLTEHNWKQDASGAHKLSFLKGKLVVKFDNWDLGVNGMKEDGSNGHTAHEHRSFIWSRKRERGKYICPSLFYYMGVLIQPRLKNVANYNKTESKFKNLARRFRFSHWWHYGFLDGQVKWFDVDSMGSGWYSWKDDGKRNENKTKANKNNTI